MKLITLLCVTGLALIYSNSFGKKRAHPLSYIQTVVTEITPKKMFKILVPQACDESLGSWRNPELGKKLNKLKKNKKCWAPNGEKLSLNLDPSFWRATTGQIQSVIFLDDDPMMIR